MLVCDFGGAQAKFGSFVNRNNETTLLRGTENYLAPEIRYELKKFSLIKQMSGRWELSTIKCCRRGKPPSIMKWLK